MPAGAGEEIALEYNQPALPVDGQAGTTPVLRVASVMQGLPDSLQRLDAAEQQRRRLRSRRRLAQSGGGIPAVDANSAAPRFVAGTSFRVDLLQQTSDKAGLPWQSQIPYRVWVMELGMRRWCGCDSVPHGPAAADVGQGRAPLAL